MNKILRSDNPELFERIIDDHCDESYSEHRRGSSFFTKWVYEVNEKWFPELDKEYYGYWESNQFVWSDDYWDRDDIRELTRVEKKEVITTTTEWVPLKD